MEHWVPLFHPAMETLLDYLPGASVSLDHQADEVLTGRLEMIADHFAARRGLPRDGEVPYRPLPPDRLYLDRAGWDAMLSGGPLLAFSPFGRMPRRRAGVGVDGGGRPGPVFAQGMGRPAAPASTCSTSCARQAERWTTEGRRIVIAAWTRGSRERIANLLREHHFKDAAQEDDLGGDPPQAGRLGVAGHAGRGARLRRRTHRPGGRAGPAGRADSPAAAAAQAGRPVHRRSHRDRRGRPGGAPGIRHRPL